MVQHMLLLMAAPLLLLGGRPVMLALRTLPRRAASMRSPVYWIDGRASSAPVPALAAFAASDSDDPPAVVLQRDVRHPLLHDVEHALYLGAGLVMWSPLRRWGSGAPPPA